MNRIRIVGAHGRAHRRAFGAFTLLELVVCVAILAVLAGAAIPVTAKVLNYKARQATLEELAVLSDASADYFQDVGAMPSKLNDLIVNPGTKSAPGWAGPYLPGVVADQLSKQDGYLVDAWSKPYTLSATGDVLKITSPGEDLTAKSDDDLSIDLDVTWIRRDRTLSRLEIVNQAILHYNSLYQLSDPLPLSYASAQKKLVSVKLLPDDVDFSADAWGDAFVPDPQGMLPVVRVNSIHLMPASGTSGSGNSGGTGKGKGKSKGKGKKGGNSNNAGGNSSNAGGNSSNAGGNSSNSNGNSGNAGGNSGNGNSGNGNSGKGNSGKGKNP